MSDSAWKGVKMIEDALARRSLKPRTAGLTMVIDTCMGPNALKEVLEVCGEYIDHWKCSYGTSVLIPKHVLQRKLMLLREWDIISYPGGTLLEAAVVQQHCRAFTERARAIGFDAAEISEGTITLPPNRRRNIIQCAIDHDLIPITEVGKKDPAHQPAPEFLAEQALKDLEWGARYVIVDARESGLGVGIFDKNGMLREDALVKIVSTMGDQAEQLIWEAPRKEQQALLIKRLGYQVNLGNIKPQDVLSLEALRTGLRYETLQRVAEEREGRGIWHPEASELTASSDDTVYARR